jgi:alpha/beta superfamily hydrolase
MKETKISTVNTFHEKLVGIETKPPVKKEKYPAVILVHGFGVTKEEYGLFDDIAKTLSEEGILVFRFDFSGCGESEGDYSETSLSKLKQDLSKILEFVKSQPDVDTSNRHFGSIFWNVSHSRFATQSKNNNLNGFSS